MHKLIALLLFGWAGAASLQGAELGATPIERIKVRPGFKVELLYTVPKDREGSWVALAVDPKGRLIVSDQYGSLYRVKPPSAAGTPAMERIDLPIGQAQGLLCAFDSLYVMVANESYQGRGLYRVRDTDGDDTYDEVRLLRKLEGGGEHGPHAIVLSPDQRWLYIISGNQTKVTPIDNYHVPPIWSEDHLLPRMWDGRGFMKGVLAPGGWIARTDPEGRTWELIATGFRNEYDAAFNRDGELFTYDADMEWDFNTPWYRPTRICLVTSGAEFGWRSGAGKWPSYYPDSLPGIFDIGPGSPTGVTFGYGAKFPSKYQEAFFVCDWSYGKLYALHLTPVQSAYRVEAEEFVTGTPLPLTDVIINPQDGAMYFAIGGRKTQSGLYRVTYVGGETTEPLKKQDLEAAKLRAVRHQLEFFHGRRDPSAIEAAWPYLKHPDRFIRFAARVALENQEFTRWRDRALEETDPQAALTALIAVCRVGETNLQSKVLDALERIKWERLSEAQQLELLRAYSLAFTRLGKPEAAYRDKVAARFDPLLPAHNPFINAELSQLLAYLQVPGATARMVKLLMEAPTQEEQIEYARTLRTVKTGWNRELREAYFKWFGKAHNFRGGASLGGFLRNIKEDALANFDEATRAELKPILEQKPEEQTPLQALGGRSFVKQWTVAELAPVVEKGLKGGRDFVRGRRMFGAVGCFACHRFAQEGGATGPDLTGVAGRFSARDLLESIIEPSKEISDQYGSIVVKLTDDTEVTGRIVNLSDNVVMVSANLFDPGETINIKRERVVSITPSKTSLMPTGLLDVLQPEEIQDLIAFLLSGGDARSPMFSGGAGSGQ